MGDEEAVMSLGQYVDAHGFITNVRTVCMVNIDPTEAGNIPCQYPQLVVEKPS